jgi:hypothetical protein
LFLPPGPFEGTYLYIVLRKSFAPNMNFPMPKTPPYAFTRADIAKINSWYTAGMMND